MDLQKTVENVFVCQGLGCGSAAPIVTLAFRRRILILLLTYLLTYTCSVRAMLANVRRQSVRQSSVVRRVVISRKLSKIDGTLQGGTKNCTPNLWQ